MLETSAWEAASVGLDHGLHFTGDIDGYTVELDGEAEAGSAVRPMRLILLGLAGCTAMDVISILRKKRQQITAFAVDVRGLRAGEHPRVYTDIEVTYRVGGTGVDPQAVARAIELSETRYCGAMGMLGRAARITSRYEIEEG